MHKRQTKRTLQLLSPEYLSVSLTNVHYAGLKDPTYSLVKTKDYTTKVRIPNIC